MSELARGKPHHKNVDTEQAHGTQMAIDSEITGGDWATHDESTTRQWQSNAQAAESDPLRVLTALILAAHNPAAGWQAPGVLDRFAANTHTHRQRSRQPARRPISMELDDSSLGLAKAFGAALSDAYCTGTIRLSETVRESASIETPLWKCENREKYEKELAEAWEFYSKVSPPSLTVLDHRKLPDGRVVVEWMLGVEWPAIWRPRINILGESILTVGKSRISEIKETWHQTPSQAFSTQLLPKIRDIAAVWSSPTAEHLPMPVIKEGDGYELVRIPGMLALQSEWIEYGDRIFLEQAPMPEAFAFNCNRKKGGLKRAEWYNCVSPNILERSLETIILPENGTKFGQRRRWICPLPTRWGVDPSDFPDPASGLSDYKPPPEVDSCSVQYVRRPAQMLAIRKISEIPGNDLVLSTAAELAEKAEKDGYRVVKSGGKPVVMQMSGDIKNGFNSEKQLAMSVWLSVYDFAREEYIGVVIEDDE